MLAWGVALALHSSAEAALSGTQLLAESWTARVRRAGLFHTTFAFVEKNKTLFMLAQICEGKPWLFTLALCPSVCNPLCPLSAHGRSTHVVTGSALTRGSVTCDPISRFLSESGTNTFGVNGLDVVEPSARHIACSPCG